MLVITLVLNLAVAVGKIVLGIVTGALAITADGFHSLTDAAGNVAGLIANTLASRPPDNTHPYGHRRFETFAALLVGALLLMTAWELIGGVIERLQEPVQPDISPLALGVLLATLCVNVFVSTYQMRAGERLQSEILIADSKNTRADVFVTLSVLVSVTVVALTGQVWVDVVAALVVVILIGRAAFEIVRDTSSVLVDRAPVDPDELTGIVGRVPGVAQVARARSRGPADAKHLDIDVLVAPETTADQTSNIAGAIRAEINACLDGVSEIDVHFTVPDGAPENPPAAARAFADRLGLSTHDVQLVQEGDSATLEMHVEVPPDLSLAAAHERVSQLEDELQAYLPDVERVVTHIEPAPVAVATDNTAHKSDVQQIEKQARTVLNEAYAHIGWHAFAVRRAADDAGYAITLHATLPAELSVEAAHAIAEAAETLLKSRIIEVTRVTIHTEPDES